MSYKQDSAAPSRPDHQDGFAPGSRIGRYRLVALLASGGMAHVWAAEPATGTGLGRTVALKVIRPELAQDLEYARMFIDEATIATAISHPNVCETYELERHENVLYMAMEWVPGDSLGGLLRQGRRFAPLEAKIAVRICADACAGLDAAHEAVDDEGNLLGVVHRDVSPPNILVSLQGQVKVSDFGIAKARYQLHERTRTGEVKGKFGYLAPEQIAGEAADRRIDVYAMGCVLYVATMGLRPFGNGPEAMTKILRGQFKRPTEIDPMYPPGLEEVIVRSLAHEPNDRYATSEEQRRALEQWLVDSRTVVTPADVAQSLRQRMEPRSLRAVVELQKRRRGKSAEVYETLLQGLEDVEPPTAASGLVVPPDDLGEMSASMPPARADDLQDAVGDDYSETLSEINDRTIREDFSPLAAEEADRSGWHKTGRTNLRDLEASDSRVDSSPTRTEVDVGSDERSSSSGGPRERLESSGEREQRPSQTEGERASGVRHGQGTPAERLSKPGVDDGETAQLSARSTSNPRAITATVPLAILVGLAMAALMWWLTQ